MSGHLRATRTRAPLAGLAIAALTAAFASTVCAATAAPQGPTTSNPAPKSPVHLIRFEAVNPNEPGGDRLGPARRLAAAVVAQDDPSPKLVVDVGSFTGEFLEAFVEQFPSAHGQWTEPVATNEQNAHLRFARFGDRVSYRIGCPARDISLGCVPAGVDVLITSWLSIHQDRDGIRKFYREAAEMLPPGGWVVNLDHVGSGDEAWDSRLHAARNALVQQGLAATTEGPPVHHPDWTTPTLDEQIAALKAAGIDDVRVVWRRLDTVLIMGRKR